MAEENNNMANNPWPQNNLRWLVVIDNRNYTFQEVSGLDEEPQNIEYRSELHKTFSSVKISALRGTRLVLLSNGVAELDNPLITWINQISTHTAKQSVVNIQLLDDSNNIIKHWKLKNAKPKQIKYFLSNGKNKEVTIRSIEISHEGFEVINTE